MLNKRHLLLSCLLITCCSYSFAQNKSLSKLEIAKGETFVVASHNSLFVDTLIMHDKSTIKFNPEFYGILEAKAAYIGKKCTITSKGEDGKDGFRNRPGTDGADGGSLTITLHFKSLDELTIDTRGGNGGRGVDGKNGSKGTNDHSTAVTTTDAAGNKVTKIVTTEGDRGTPGGNATGGGNSGNGGNLMLVYSTVGFIPVFNNVKAHNSINVFHTAGANGTSGIPGIGGIQSQDGIVIYENGKEPRTAHHGQVTLVDMNSEMVRQSE